MRCCTGACERKALWATLGESGSHTSRKYTRPSRVPTTAEREEGEQASVVACACGGHKKQNGVSPAYSWLSPLGHWGGRAAPHTWGASDPSTAHMQAHMYKCTML